jgi:hypothetical protein
MCINGFEEIQGKKRMIKGEEIPNLPENGIPLSPFSYTKLNSTLAMSHQVEIQFKFIIDHSVT